MKFQTKKKKIRDNLRISRFSFLVNTDVNRTTLWNIYKEKVNETIRLFTYGWSAMWIIWCVFYTLLLLGFKDQSLLMDFINYVGTGAFIFMYITLSKSTSNGQYKKWLYGILSLMVSLIVFEILINRIVEPNNHFWEIDTTLLFWYRLFVGIFAAASFSTVFGRLTSKFIDIPLEVSVFLFAYAAIQPLYAVFSVEVIQVEKINTFDKDIYLDIDIIKDMVIYLAFTLKTLLLIVITWILRTGRLLFFVTQEGSINFTQDEQLITLLESANTE